MLAPSHSRVALAARRLSGGVVKTTYAAAIPAAVRIRFAVDRAEALVTLSSDGCCSIRCSKCPVSRLSKTSS